MTFYRRNLPHWHPEGKSIFITWRLYGSLPASVLKRIRTATNDRSTNPAEADSEESPGRIFRQLDATLDSARSGPLWLPAKRSNYLSSPHPFAPSANACGDSCLRFVGVHTARCRNLRSKGYGF